MASDEIEFTDRVHVRGRPGVADAEFWHACMASTGRRKLNSLASLDAKELWCLTLATIVSLLWRPAYNKS